MRLSMERPPRRDELPGTLAGSSVSAKPGGRDLVVIPLERLLVSEQAEAAFLQDPDRGGVLGTREGADGRKRERLQAVRHGRAHQLGREPAPPVRGMEEVADLGTPAGIEGVDAEAAP